MPDNTPDLITVVDGVGVVIYPYDDSGGNPFFNPLDKITLPNSDQYNVNDVQSIDTDNDGLIDVVLSIDTGENVIYKNNGDGTFANPTILGPGSPTGPYTTPTDPQDSHGNMQVVPNRDPLTDDTKPVGIISGNNFLSAPDVDNGETWDNVEPEPYWHGPPPSSQRRSTWTATAMWI